MKTIGIALALLGLLTACGDGTEQREEAAPAAPALVLQFDGGEREADGSYRLELPLQGPVPLKLRLANEGNPPVQVCHSSFPFYYFFKLEVVRLGKDGERTPVEPHWDLYPMKDMKMPNRVFVTLGPGEAFERDLAVLVKEGYLLESLRGGVFGHGARLEGEGFGALREPGNYEVVGVWSPEPSTLSGSSHRMFQSDVGRDESVQLWQNGPVRTEPLRVTVVKSR